MHIFYLHGFASSPSSGKARFFSDRLAEFGLTLASPDFNLPDFGTLTVTRMLDQVDAAIESKPPGPVTLIGSSLGGFVALHAADRRHRVAGQARPVTRLVLLAPAFDFGSDRRLDPIVDEWRRTGQRQIFHFGYGRSMDVGYALYEDARRYDSGRVDLDIPILVFQGRHDDIVRPSAAIEFAECRPNVSLRLLDDDHLLQRHLPEMWRETAGFLGIEKSR